MRIVAVCTTDRFVWYAAMSAAASRRALHLPSSSLLRSLPLVAPRLDGTQQQLQCYISSRAARHRRWLAARAGGGGGGSGGSVAAAAAAPG